MLATGNEQRGGASSSSAVTADGLSSSGTSKSSRTAAALRAQDQYYATEPQRSGIVAADSSSSSAVKGNGSISSSSATSSSSSSSSSSSVGNHENEIFTSNSKSSAASSSRSKSSGTSSNDAKNLNHTRDQFYSKSYTLSSENSAAPFLAQEKNEVEISIMSTLRSAEAENRLRKEQKKMNAAGMLNAATSRSTRKKKAHDQQQHEAPGSGTSSGNGSASARTLSKAAEGTTEEEVVLLEKKDSVLENLRISQEAAQKAAAAGVRAGGTSSSRTYIAHTNKAVEVSSLPTSLPQPALPQFGIPPLSLEQQEANLEKPRGGKDSLQPVVQMKLRISSPTAADLHQQAEQLIPIEIREQQQPHLRSSSEGDFTPSPGAGKPVGHQLHLRQSRAEGAEEEAAEQPKESLYRNQAHQLFYKKKQVTRDGLGRNTQFYVNNYGGFYPDEVEDIDVREAVGVSQSRTRPLTAENVEKYNNHYRDDQEIATTQQSREDRLFHHLKLPEQHVVPRGPHHQQVDFQMQEHAAQNYHHDGAMRSYIVDDGTTNTLVVDNSKTGHDQQFFQFGRNSLGPVDFEIRKAQQDEMREQHQHDELRGNTSIASTQLQPQAVVQPPPSDQTAIMLGRETSSLLEETREKILQQTKETEEVYQNAILEYLAAKNLDVEEARTIFAENPKHRILLQKQHFNDSSDRSKRTMGSKSNTTSSIKPLSVRQSGVNVDQSRELETPEHHGIDDKELASGGFLEMDQLQQLAEVCRRIVKSYYAAQKSDVEQTREGQQTVAVLPEHAIATVAGLTLEIQKVFEECRYKKTAVVFLELYAKTQHLFAFLPH